MFYIAARQSIGAVLEPDAEEEMNQILEKQAQEAAEKNVSEAYDSPEDVNVGIETEVALVDKNGDPISETDRDKAIGKGPKEHPENVDKELGVTQGEIVGDPVLGISSTKELEETVAVPERKLEESSEDLEVLRHGTNPAVSLGNVERTEALKYQLVPDKYAEMRKREAVESFGLRDIVDPRNADIPAVICSTQLNMQAGETWGEGESPDVLEDAVEKANIGYAVAPYVTALSTNSRFIDGKDLGFKDSRVPLWQYAFDIGEFEIDRFDVGRLDEFYDDFRDYVDRIKEQPRILNSSDVPREVRESIRGKAFNVGQGMYWKDSRIKLYEGEELRDDVLVEFRQNSTQPTAAEDTAVASFYVGRVVYEQRLANQPIHERMGIDKVNQNRRNAMRDGLAAELYNKDGNLVPAEEAVREELEKAEEGLEYAGIEDSHLDILYRRLEQRRTPADEVSNEYESRLPDKGYGELDPETKRKAIVEAVRDVSGREVGM